MTREFFNEQFAALYAAYLPAQKMPQETQEVYWKMLSVIRDEVFSQAVKYCLQTSKFFPTIAELGEACYSTVTRLGRYNPYGESLIEVEWPELAEEDNVRREQIEARRKLDGPKN